ncbi:predicted protein, partial [Nematostella vectensis]
CWSHVGFVTTKLQPGPQSLSLGAGCSQKVVIMHELMHALGFWHEQSRPDRNQYVEVMWENIIQGKEHNFNKQGHEVIDVLGTTYDMDSLMHYGTMGFSSNGQPTLRALSDPNRILGQMNGFSSNDVVEINKLYDCTNGSNVFTVIDACDFDKSYCSWTQDHSDTNRYQWFRRRGRTPSRNTGPDSDHTTGKGRYIYVEASFPARPGQTARLLSQEFPAGSGRMCLQFYYSMYGKGMGTLNVYTNDTATGSLNNIFMRSGDQGKNWHHGQAVITDSNAYKVVLESVIGPSFLSDIAIDDVSFLTGDCPAPTLPPS